MNITGLIVKYGEDDMSLATDILVSEEDTKKIFEILEPYVNDGYSVRGTMKDIKEEFAQL